MAREPDIFDRLLEIAFLLQQDMASSFQGTALTPARAHLLWELHRLGPSPQQALATALDVSPRNVTGLVDALEDAGFVERRPHPHDRRATSVTLTARGTETVKGMVRERQQTADRLADALDPGRLPEFRRDLDTVTERLRSLVAGAKDVRTAP
ncbi:MAG TPA: MarR family transcriptional regulator [Propionibacteriaceae bacterium]|nr:MarR family transcriptional regulator [Propionibacteriaceae bacterium]